MMPVIWRPPRPRSPDSPRPQTGQTDQQLKEKEQQQQWWQHTAEYAGYNYVAAFGQYWELACAGKRVRVRAAQLQHRVPCWGYVFEELPPTPAAVAAGQAAQEAGMRHAGGAGVRGSGRKVRAGGEWQRSQRQSCSRGKPQTLPKLHTQGRRLWPLAALQALQATSVASHLNLRHLCCLLPFTLSRL